LERRGFVEAILAAIGLSQARVVSALSVRIDRGPQWPMGIMVLHAENGMPVSEVLAHEEQLAAIRALDIGEELDIERFKMGPDGPYLVWSDGTPVDPNSERAGPGMVRRLVLWMNLAAGSRFSVAAEPDPQPATFWTRIRRVA